MKFWKRNPSLGRKNEGLSQYSYLASALSSHSQIVEEVADLARGGGKRLLERFLAVSFEEILEGGWEQKILLSPDNDPPMLSLPRR